VEKEVLDELYDSTELYHGARIQYPWRGKGGKVTHWSAIFVDPEQERGAQETVEKIDSSSAAVRLRPAAEATDSSTYCTIISHKLKRVFHPQ